MRLRGHVTIVENFTRFLMPWCNDFQVKLKLGYLNRYRKIITIFTNLSRNANKKCFRILSHVFFENTIALK